MPDNFWINSLGEYGWGGESSIGGSINIADLSNLNREEQNAVADVRLRKQVEERCKPDEALLYWHRARLADRFGSDRWRFNAAITEEHGVVLLLSTEFKHEREDKDFWALLRLAARDFGADVEEMFDWGDEGLQVSIEWNVALKSDDEVGELIRAFESKTQDLWTNAGVSVI